MTVVAVAVDAGVLTAGLEHGTALVVALLWLGRVMLAVVPFEVEGSDGPVTTAAADKVEGGSYLYRVSLHHASSPSCECITQSQECNLPIQD